MMWNRWAGRRANLVLEFHRRRRQYRLLDRGGYETRNAATTHLLVEALARCKHELATSFSLPTFTDDFVRRAPAVPHFAYCADDTQRDTIAIPDFTFWGWPEVGIADYEHTADAILEAGARPAVDPRLFWIGNPDTHPTRGQFLALAAHDPRIHAISVTWIKDASAPSVATMSTVGNRYVTLADHCRYRYLIDLQGRGYSGRVKLLLFSGRPLFLQTRRWKEYFYKDLQPLVHYIPVREDLSDLGEQLAWADDHADEARRIAENARRFAISRLRRSNAIDELCQSLIGVARRSTRANSSETSAAPAES